MAQYQNIIFIVAIVAAFWFLIIRPQQQRQKAQAELMSNLGPGQEIVTIGGIFATIVEVGEDRILVEVADGSQLEISKRAIGQLVPARDDEDDEEADADDADADEASADDAADDEAPADAATGSETADADPEGDTPDV